MKISATELMDLNLEAKDGAIGKLDDLLFDENAWCLQHLVVDTGPLFLGRKVLINPNLVSLNAARGRVEVDLTKDAIRESPDLKTDPPLSEDTNVDPPSPDRPSPGPITIFGARYMAAGEPTLVAPATSADIAYDSGTGLPAADRDYALRSVRSLIGFDVVSGQEVAGEVADFVLDEEGWQLPYIVAEVEDRDIVIPVDRVTRLGPPDEVLVVNVPMAALLDAPKYDPALTRDSAFWSAVERHFAGSR